MPDTNGRWSWRLFGLLLFVFALFGTVWSIAQPRFSGADEPEHFYHAEAVWSGQWVPPLASGPKQWDTQFRASKVDVNKANFQICYLVDPNGQPKPCPGNQGTTAAGAVSKNSPQVYDYVGREPPLPMLLTGLPIYASPTKLGLYLSRFLTTLIGAACLATAITLALAARRRALALGVVVAATPSVFAGYGVFNSSPLEIGCAAVLWVCVVLLAREEEISRSLIAITSAFGVILLLSRPVSFVYLAFAAGALLALCPWNRLRAILRDRYTQVGFGCVGAVGVLSLVWYKLVEAPVNPYYLADDHLPHITALGQKVSASMSGAQNNWMQSIGSSGFNEYNGPFYTTLLWTALIFAVIAIGLWHGRRSDVATVGGLIFALLALPVIAQTITISSTYLYWQGRYDIPTMAGILIIAASCLDRPDVKRHDLDKLILCGVVVMTLAQLMEFAGTLRRFVVGLKGPLNPLYWSHGWRPPLMGGAELFVLGVIVIPVVYFVIYRALVPPDPQDTLAASPINP